MKKILEYSDLEILLWNQQHNLESNSILLRKPSIYTVYFVSTPNFSHTEPASNISDLTPSIQNISIISTNSLHTNHHHEWSVIQNEWRYTTCIKVSVLGVILPGRYRETPVVVFVRQI